MKFKKNLLLWNYWANLNQFCWNDPWVVPFQNCVRQRVLYPRWPPLLKIEISSKGQNCSILSQNVPKFELYKYDDELFSIYITNIDKKKLKKFFLGGNNLTWKLSWNVLKMSWKVHKGLYLFLISNGLSSNLKILNTLAYI